MGEKKRKTMCIERKITEMKKQLEKNIKILFNLIIK